MRPNDVPPQPCRGGSRPALAEARHSILSLPARSAAEGSKDASSRGGPRPALAETLRPQLRGQLLRRRHRELAGGRGVAYKQECHLAEDVPGLSSHRTSFSSKIPEAQGMLNTHFSLDSGDSEC